MKIAFPTRDNEHITNHFGNMKAMLVVDVADSAETGREFRDMSDTPECGDGTGSRPAHVLTVLSDCDVLIANGIGAPLVDKARQSGLEVVLTSNLAIDQALAGYLAGTLTHEAELAHAPHH